MSIELLCIDVETKDPYLKTKGPGVRRGDGHIAGIAVGLLYSTGEIATRYLPMRHPDSLNLSPLEVARQLRDLVELDVPVTGANLIYDMDWIQHEFPGIKFRRWEDIQIAEPLIDENMFSYSLDALGKKYLAEGKDSDSLYMWCAQKFGGKADKSQAANIWRCPVWVINNYVNADVRLPLMIHSRQKEELERQGLLEIWDIECRLQPLLLAMKQRGVRVDVEGAHRMKQQFKGEFAATMAQLQVLNGGVPVEVWAAASVARLFDKLGLAYPRTQKEAPSFTKEFLAAHRHPAAQLVLAARQLDKLCSTFLQGSIIDNAVEGRIHCQFNQLRGDEYGTVTGRLSSSLPNLQQVPARSKIGKMIRTLFLPEEGEQWAKLDYSQIEPRLVLSYAQRSLVQNIVDAYSVDPALDCYNQMMRTMPDTLDRNAVKAIYLGATYGMGKDLMAANMGLSVEEAEPHFEAFHGGAPYIKRLSNQMAGLAEDRGYIRTIGGRRRHFELWEPAKFTRGAKGLPREEAQAAYGPALRRAYAYKALNCCIQGGAADIMKRAMVEAFEAGLPVPLLTVHDEVDLSFDEPTVEGIEGVRAYQAIMESVYREKLRVPMRVDVEAGPNWGTVK